MDVKNPAAHRQISPPRTPPAPARRSAPYPLAFCLNVSEPTDWPTLRKMLRETLWPLKKRVAPHRSFPVSLHLGQRAVQELSRAEPLRAFRRWLADHDCFLAALNAFPYEHFHARRVKANVFQPDWRETARREYTLAAARLLAELLPEGAGGSLTTVPGGWQADWKTRADHQKALKNLEKAAAACRRLAQSAGHPIRIAIEPEPGGAWNLFQPSIEMLGPEIGWCLDTSHAAVDFLDLESLRWERICRVQLSAALEADNTPRGRRALAAFAERRYLHQTRAAVDGTIIGAWPDLAPALRALPRLPAPAIIRTHFHLPLTWAGTAALRSTRQLLSPAVFRAAKDIFCEVETYTYSVLPADLRPHSAVEAMAGELLWAVKRLQGVSSSTNRKMTSPGLA